MPGKEIMGDTNTLTREAWIRRFADRIKEVAKWDEEGAIECATEAANQHERNERAAGNTIDWMDPEDEADVEMSYWDDDGE